MEDSRCGVTRRHKLMMPCVPFKVAAVVNLNGLALDNMSRIALSSSVNFRNPMTSSALELV